MKTEIEVKFVNVEIDDIRKRLKSVGGILEQPMRMMKRALIEEPHHHAEASFIRIRDEGHKVTLTYKRRDGDTIDGAKEIEIDVSDFDKTLELFEAAGWSYKTFQESKRETWRLGGVEVVIDEWPWIAPYIEIEGESEEAIKEAATKLGFDWSEAVFGSVDVIYEATYPNMSNRGVIDIKEVRFGDPVPKEFIGERA